MNTDLSLITLLQLIAVQKLSLHYYPSSIWSINRAVSYPKLRSPLPRDLTVVPFSLLDITWGKLHLTLVIASFLVTWITWRKRMNTAEIKQRITQKLNELDADQLTLIDSLLNQITAHLYKTTPEDAEQPDPLASLRNSDFIGCFSGDPNLATDSEEIAHQILSRSGDNHL
jgi:hypothetical protein